MTFSSYKSLFGIALSTILLSTSGSIYAQAPAPNAVQGKTEILWLGQAGFRIKSPGGKIIVIARGLQEGQRRLPCIKMI